VFEGMGFSLLFTTSVVVVGRLLPSSLYSTGQSMVQTVGLGVAPILGATGLGAWGGRLDVLRDRRRLRLHADFEAAATGRTTTSLGHARALLGSLGAFAGARFAPSAPFAWSFAAGMRFGVARLDGVPDVLNDAVGSAAWRPWGGPALSARASVGGPRLAAVVSLEVGYTALGAEALAASTTVLALRGPWLTIAAGAAF